MPDRSRLDSVVATVSGNPPPGADWMELIAAANASLVTATMAARLREKGLIASLPADAQDFLRDVLERAEERSAMMMAQLAEAVEQLNRAGVTPLLIKGAAILGAPGPQRSAGRILADLDLVVAPRALPAALAALQAIGYARDEQAGHAPSATAVFRPEDAGSIDLHEQFHTLRLQFDFDRLRSGGTLVKLGQGEAWLPSPTMQLAVLVAHDQLRDRDYWRGHIDIRHLFDAANLIESGDGIDWDLLDSLFPAGASKSALRTYCRTIHVLLGAPVPAELRRGWRAGLQYRRRMLQARWPAVMLPATVLSVLLDPPIPPFELVAKIAHELRHSEPRDLLFRIRRRVRTFLTSARAGKL